MRLIGIALTMAIVMSGSCFATYTASETDPMLTDSQKEAGILHSYEAEIALVEELHEVNIDHIDEAALRLLKQEAINHLEDDTYDFAGLMDALSVAFAEQEILKNYEDRLLTKISGIEVKNLTSRVVHTYGVLNGTHYDTLAPIGTTITGSIELKLSVGGTIHGIAITEGGSFSSSAVLDRGPSGGEKLYNGSTATHRMICGILYGAITETTWDLVDRHTGEVKSSHRSTQIPVDPSELRAFTTLVYINSAGQWQVDSLDTGKKSTGTWASKSAFRKALAKSAVPLMEGSASAVCPICKE